MLLVRDRTIAEVGQVGDSAAGQADQASVKRGRLRLGPSGKMIAADSFQGSFEVSGIEGFAAFPACPIIRLGTAKHAAAIRKVQKASKDEQSRELDQFKNSHTPGRRKHSK